MQFKMDNKTYDFWRWIASIVLPAIGTLFFSVAKIWGVPYATEILGTLSAVITFLNVILGISDAKYDAEKANTYTVGNEVED